MANVKMYEVEYRLPYEHVVVVGVKAKSPERAVALAQREFDKGTIWDNKESMPLLFDDYEEKDGVLEFTAKEVDHFKADPSVEVCVQQACLYNAILLLRKVHDGALEDGDHREIAELLATIDSWNKAGDEQ